jgi:hypothetical protein
MSDAPVMGDGSESSYSARRPPPAALDAPARAELHLRLQDVQIGVLLRAVAALEARVAAQRAEVAGLRDELRALQRRVGEVAGRDLGRGLPVPGAAPAGPGLGWVVALLLGVVLGVLLAAVVWWALGAGARPVPPAPRPVGTGRGELRMALCCTTEARRAPSSWRVFAPLRLCDGLRGSPVPDGPFPDAWSDPEILRSAQDDRLSFYLL